MKKKGIFRTRSLSIFVTIFLLTLTTASLSQEKTATTLLNTVVSLKLGLNGYTIGQQLDSTQKKEASEHMMEGAYQDTYKFVDKDLFVVVDQKSDRVLALYKQKKEADKSQLKKMVTELMDHFDAPTTMAHEKILYWAFNKYGAISEDDFNTAKKIKQIADLGIIATVKLNSEMEITPDPKENNKKISGKKTGQTGSIYFIITSDPMVQQFINSRK